MFVYQVIEEANDFCKTFENYSYLWLEERDAIMEIFLEYGRILTTEEIDKIGSEDKEVRQPVPSPPKMEAFREQIDHYENLYMDIEDMESYKVFNSWFQVSPLTTNSRVDNRSSFIQIWRIHFIFLRNIFRNLTFDNLTAFVLFLGGH